MSRQAFLVPADPLALRVPQVSMACQDGMVNLGLVDLLDLLVNQDPKEKE